MTLLHSFHPLLLRGFFPEGQADDKLLIQRQSNLFSPRSVINGCVLDHRISIFQDSRGRSAGFDDIILKNSRPASSRGFVDSNEKQCIDFKCCFDNEIWKTRKMLEILINFFHK